MNAQFTASVEKFDAIEKVITQFVMWTGKLFFHRKLVLPGSSIFHVAWFFYKDQLTLLKHKCGIYCVRIIYKSSSTDRAKTTCNTIDFFI